MLAVRAPLVVTLTFPLSLESLILAWTPVPGAFVSPITPTVTSTSLAVDAPPLAIALTPKLPAPPEALILPEVSTVMAAPLLLSASRPTALAPLTEMSSRNTAPDLPTVTAPSTLWAVTPRATPVMVFLEAPEATSTVPAPVAEAKMPTPPVVTSPSAVTETLPVSPDPAWA